MFKEWRHVVEKRYNSTHF